MTIPGSAISLLSATAGAPAGYTIERSLRFNSADSAYLNRTPSSAGNRKTWTWAGWVKRSALQSGTSNTYMQVFSAGTSGAARDVFFFDTDTDDTLAFYSANGLAGAGILMFRTNAVFRDASAWYHIVLAVDTTQSTAANRVKLYVNGAEQTFSTVSYPSQNAEGYINLNNAHYIATHPSLTEYFSGYLADVQFIDGQALAPTDFGEFDDNGVWQPIEYTGTYGTNGFHLDFETPSDLGNDVSGNNNDWTPNNFGVGDSSQSWSNTTTPSNTSFQFPYTRGFDGTITGDGGTKGFAGWLSSAGDITITFPSGVSVSNTIDIYSGDGIAGSTTASITVNGSTTTSAAASGYVTTKSFSGVSGNLESITLTEDGGGVRFYGIAIDGVILIDPYDTDSLLDSPTNGTQTDTGAGGEVSGNYCTLNAAKPSTGVLTISNGALVATQASGATDYPVTGTIFVNSGKWYWEVDINDPFCYAGIATPEGANIESTYVGEYSGQAVYNVGSKNASWIDGVIYNYTTATTATGAQTIGVALDFDSNQVTFYKNGTSMGVFGSNFIVGRSWGPAAKSNGTATLTHSFNFGQRPFSYSAPSGFKALCTASLDDPTIADGSTAMDVALWTGTNTSAARTISGLKFSPDLVWAKARSLAYSNNIYDTVRGTGQGLYTDSTQAEATNSAFGYISTFTSDGFTGTPGSTDNGFFNETNDTYVAWTWDGGTSTVSNTDGTITSSVRANPSAGFSVVTYNHGSGVGASTIGHGLGAAPSLILSKFRDGTTNWDVYVRALGAGGRLILNSTGAFTSETQPWNNTNPTSTVFSVGASSWKGAGNHVAYCFAPVEGYSAFGSYTGNGSATDGPFVFTNFRPRWILVRSTSANRGWVIWDTSRDPHNVANANLFPNNSNAESSSSDHNIDILSNGFKLRTTSANRNGSGETYIYAAFAENPFKTARAR